MKRFGLKAIAAALALTMVASLGVPATAKAEDVKFIAAAPKAGNVLEITQSMVDADGELVLSGEKLDKVVIPNDVDVKRVYVDGSEIGELSIESGNTPEIQIWDAQIKDVTVTPSELIDLNSALVEYIDVMLASETPEAYDIGGFINDIQAKNKALSTEAPKVVLKGADMETGQKIENLTLTGNAKVDCAGGVMPGALNVAYTAGAQDMSVTISGYVGDMNVTQNKAANGAFGILDVKTENSLLGSVNVATEGDGNVILRSPDSVVETVNYTSVGDGTAKGLFSLNMPANNLVTDAGAKNCNISVLSSVDNIQMDGTAVALDVGPNAEVMEATIAGAENSMTGAGNVAECTIAEGCTATVTMAGISNVAGNNTFAPVVPMPQLPKPEPPSDIVLVAMQPESVTVTGNKATMDGGYKTAYYVLPNDIDGSKVSAVKVKFSSDQQICIKVKDPSGTSIKEDYPNYGVTEMTEATKTYAVPSGTVSQIEFMSLDNKVNIKVSSIEYMFREEVEGGDDSGEIPVFNFADLQQGGYGYEANVVDGAVTGTISNQYQEIQFTLPQEVNLAPYTQLVLELDTDKKIDVKLKDATDATFVDSYSDGAVTSTYTIDLTDDMRLYGLKKICVMAMVSGETTSFTIKSMTFVKPGSAIPVYNFADLQQGGYGYEANIVDGAVEGTISNQYQEIQFTLPSLIDLSKYTKVILELECAKQLDIKLKDSDGATFQDAYSGGAISSPHVVNLTDDAKVQQLAKVCLMAMVSGETTDFWVKSITFE